MYGQPAHHPQRNKLQLPTAVIHLIRRVLYIVGVPSSLFCKHVQIFRVDTV